MERFYGDLLGNTLQLESRASTGITSQTSMYPGSAILPISLKICFNHRNELGTHGIVSRTLEWTFG